MYSYQVITRVYISVSEIYTSQNDSQVIQVINQAYTKYKAVYTTKGPPTVPGKVSATMSRHSTTFPLPLSLVDGPASTKGRSQAVNNEVYRNLLHYSQGIIYNCKELNKVTVQQAKHYKKIDL